MSRSMNRMIHAIYLILSPLGSSLLFCLLENHETVVGDGLALPFQGSIAPVIYLFFGICVVFWNQVYKYHANRMIGWGLVIVLTLLYLFCSMHVIALPNILPALLIWIGAMITSIILS